VQDYELIAQEVNALGPRIHDLEERMAELADQVADVQKVNARLEAAALTTARSLQQIATHWDAVYEAMRRQEIAEDDGEAEDVSE
jgi:predicted  nucleic acid-binding Zn-ribbon protein